MMRKYIQILEAANIDDKDRTKIEENLNTEDQ